VPPVDSANDLNDLVRRLRANDPRAADEVYAVYAQRLTRLAERHLSRRVAQREDGEDVVQSALRTFFRRQSEGEFRLDSNDELWRLLARITLMKARAKARRHTAAARDVGAEAGGDAWWLDTLAREPGVDDAILLMDQIDSLLSGLPDVFRDLLELRLRGDHVTYIARNLGLSRQTIYEMLKRLRARLERSASERAE
jgi:DNA-directed RNA polymerase specialized sigma24 family protein